MNSKQVDQENLCLNIKFLCDLLRTKLFCLDDFDDYDYYAKELKKLKSLVDSIYWDL